jgi:hypothetical protein
MVHEIRLGRGALMRGKTQKRAGGLLNTGGCIFFKRRLCHMGGGVLNPLGGEVMAGKLGVSWSFLKRADSREKAQAGFASKVKKPFSPIAG